MTSLHCGIAVFLSDTDVEVLACHHQAAIPVDIILISGTRSRLRLIGIPCLRERLGSSVCQVLPSLYSLTGCDTVSSYVGKGKKKGLKIVKDDQIARETALVLGEIISLSEQNTVKLEDVVCKLYNERQCNHVDELRYKISYKGKNLQSHQLSPTSAAFKNHLKRANYQVHIWKRALEPQTTDEGSEDQGLQLRKGGREIVWTEDELVCCGCRRIWQTRRCSCVSNV